MAQRAVLPAEIARSAIQLARALTMALRGWSVDRPDHPAGGRPVDRLADAARAATAHGVRQLTVTPRTPLIDGAARESHDLSVSDCDARRHDRDLLPVACAGAPGMAALRALVAVLALDRTTRRARGGPAAIWAVDGPDVGLDPLAYL